MKRRLVTRPHTIKVGDRSVPVGIQVGWAGIDKNGEPWEIYWGSTKNEATLQELFSSLRAEGYDFEWEGECTLTPPGWYCTRKKGHPGPCASHLKGEPIK